MGSAQSVRLTYLASLNISGACSVHNRDIKGEAVIIYHLPQPLDNEGDGLSRYARGVKKELDCQQFFEVQTAPIKNYMKSILTI